MEPLAVPILTAIITALIVYIVQRVSSGQHALRNETQTLVAGIRTDVQALTKEVGKLQGALEERSRVYELLEKMMEKHISSA